MKTRRNANRTANGLKLARSHARRALAISIAVTMFTLPLVPGVFASPGRDTYAVTGIIRVAGTVTIDGAQVTSGQTIFPGSHVVTLGESESIIDLGNLTRLRLLAETDLTLDFSRANISATLARGSVRGFIPAGIPVSISTAGGELTTDPGQPAEFLIQVVDDSTKVSVTKGRVELRTEDGLQAVSAGEIFPRGSASQTPPDPDDDLTNRQKVGIFAVIGAAAVILAVALTGKDEEEPEFGDCVIILCGEGSTCR